MRFRVTSAARFHGRHLEYYETNQLDLVEPYGYARDWLRIPGVKLPPEVLEKFSTTATPSG